jgi:hypothetical protein
MADATPLHLVYSQPNDPKVLTAPGRLLCTQRPSAHRLQRHIWTHFACRQFIVTTSSLQLIATVNTHAKAIATMSRICETSSSGELALAIFDPQIGIDIAKNNSYSPSPPRCDLQRHQPLAANCVPCETQSASAGLSSILYLALT